MLDHRIKSLGLVTSFVEKDDEILISYALEMSSLFTSIDQIQ
jgi:hypothetical protein